MQRLHISVSIASGIHHLHSRDPVVIHQDLKPLNVMVGIIQKTVTVYLTLMVVRFLYLSTCMCTSNVCYDGRFWWLSLKKLIINVIIHR